MYVLNYASSCVNLPNLVREWRRTHTLAKQSNLLVQELICGTVLLE
jgi:hypothetical protein